MAIAIAPSPPQSAPARCSRLLTPLGGRQPLRQAGKAQLLMDEGPPLAMDEILAVPKGMRPGISMHESTLKELWCTKESPRIRGLGLVQDSLERDALQQREKYGGAEPSKGAARFHVRLPQGPQHVKYSLRASTAPSGASRIRGASCNGITRAGSKLAPFENVAGPLPPLPAKDTFGSMRFDKQRLKGWFREIDQKKTGSISQRELIIALRSMKGLQAMFCMVNGIEYVDSGAGSAMGEAAVQAKREEVRRIKEILTEIDTDGSGTMEWEEFVEFFRKAGLLLEYQTQESYNRTSLCEADMGDKAKNVGE